MTTIQHIVPHDCKSRRRAGAAIFLLCMAAGMLPNAWAQKQAAGQDAAVQPAPQKSAARVRVVDTIAAVVNNEVITMQELEERMRLIERRMKEQNVAMPPRDQLQRQLLERMIVDKIQLQRAKELGIRVDDVLLDRAVARIAEQNRMSLQEFRNQLEREGTPFNQFREEVRNDIIRQRLREREVDNKIQISESEVDNYLASNAGAGQAQTELNLAQILIRIPENASAEQIAQRKQRAEEAIRQLKSGADFAKVAAAYSDSDDALKGGEIGWRNEDRLPQLFLDAVAERKPGDIAVAKSANGFHILKLLGRRTAAPAKNGAALPAVQQTHVRHILIKVNQVMSSAEARRKLVELKERLDNHAAKFEDLAKLYSNDLSASRGGDLGWVYPGDTVPEFERAMNALQPGQVSDPIETPFGWHLIQVIERKTDDVSQERQRLAARQVLRERKLEEATEEWLRQLRDRAYVEYRLDDADAR